MRLVNYRSAPLFAFELRALPYSKARAMRIGAEIPRRRQITAVV